MQAHAPLHRLYNSQSRIWILVLTPVLSLVLLYTWLGRPHSLLLEQLFLSDDSHSDVSGSNGGDGINNVTPAEGLAPEVLDADGKIPGMDDILVILKTGMTESLSKIPIHLETTLSRIPHFAIFSDLEEEIAGTQAHDVLAGIDETVKSMVPEFELYTRIRDHGRDALTPADYGDDSNGPFGRQNNPGWRLDKWKFLPMIPAALDQKPDAKWYVFMEADSYFVWPNLVEWLSRLDSGQDWYLGYPMQIGDTLFAYGGSGFVVSNPAMRRLMRYMDDTPQAQINDYIVTQWAGDCVLGKMFTDAGVGLNWAWPMLQDNKPWEVDSFATMGDKRAWCFPVVSYHHMQPDDVRRWFEFDRDWFSSGNSTLLYSDVFRRLVLPVILSQCDGWDNAAETPITGEDESLLELTFDECSSKCTDDENCLSYRYKEEEKNCYVSPGVRKGSAAEGIKSNWMIDRIHDKIAEYGTTCEEVEYVS